MDAVQTFSSSLVFFDSPLSWYLLNVGMVSFETPHLGQGLNPDFHFQAMKATEPSSLWVNAIESFGILAEIFCLIFWIQAFPQMLV